MKLNNLSNGKTDGIVLFYMKDEKLHPILFNEEQATMLDLVIKTPFMESPLKIVSTPVEYRNIKDMIID